MEVIFTFSQKCKKVYEYQQQLQLIFIDQEKDFNHVNRNKLWEVLVAYSINSQLLDSIMAIYACSESILRTPSGLTNWFKITSGVQQGCILLPLLFMIYRDKITKASNPEPENLNRLLLADDQCVVNNDMVKLQDYVECLSSCCENYDMRINTTKTNVMSAGYTTSNLSISIGRKCLYQIAEYKHLGSIFSENGKMNREIKARILRANALIYQLLPLLQLVVVVAIVVVAAVVVIVAVMFV